MIITTISGFRSFFFFSFTLRHYPYGVLFLFFFVRVDGCVIRSIYTFDHLDKQILYVCMYVCVYATDSNNSTGTPIA